jgi:hypothetical protein
LDGHYDLFRVDVAPSTDITLNANEEEDIDSGIIPDISISVFSMEDISSVLAHLVGREGASGVPSLSSSSTTTVMHARDRSDATYATSSILADMSVDDCDGDMIRRICALYHVDVELMRWLGFGGVAVERCA